LQVAPPVRKPIADRTLLEPISVSLERSAYGLTVMLDERTSAAVGKERDRTVMPPLTPPN